MGVPPEREAEGNSPGATWPGAPAVLDPPPADPVVLDPPSGAPAVLDRAREFTLPKLREAVGRLSPDVSLVAAYHLGWVDVDGTSCDHDSGKMVRPALVLLSAEAAMRPAQVAVPAAAAVELVHNFSLLHDDIMDGDERRRGRPTAWTAFGPARALLAGDALLALAVELLLEAGTAAGAAAAALLVRTSRTLIDGQAADLALSGRRRASTAESLAMAADKTGALLACAAGIGAVLAGAPSATVSRLRAFGAHLGLAFQLVDDVLGIWGDPTTTGKPVRADLRERKKSLPVAFALEQPGAERIAELLGGTAAGEEDLRLAADLIEQVGGRAWALQRAEAELHRACAELQPLEAPPAVKDEFAEIACYATRRAR